MRTLYPFGHVSPPLQDNMGTGVYFYAIIPLFILMPAMGGVLQNALFDR